MAISAPPKDYKRPAKDLGLFSPACASCGKYMLDTSGGKYKYADAGYCPSCGVFVGFECARKAGWQNWKRLCPACGTRLRTNSMLIFGVIGGMSILLLSAMFIPGGFISIRQGEIDETQAEMPAADPGQVHPGDTVKIAGTVAGPQDTPIIGTYTTSGNDQYFAWETYDFYVNCTNGTVTIHASILSGTDPTSGKIIGSDGDRGAYHVGFAIVVIGVVSDISPQVVIEPSRIVPNSAALDKGLVMTGWWELVVGTLALLPLPASLWALIHRYRSHRRRIGDFKTREHARPLESIDQVSAIEAPARPPKHREDIIRSSAEGTTVEELERRIKPDQ